MGALFQYLALAVVTLLNSYGHYLPGARKDAVLLFYLTPDHHVAVAELDAKTKAVRSERRIAPAPPDANMVRAARSAGGFHLVVGAEGHPAPVRLLRLGAAFGVEREVEIGDGALPTVTADARSATVVTAFYEEREPNEGPTGRERGLAPPTKVLRVQVRDGATLACVTDRVFMGRNAKRLAPFGQPHGEGQTVKLVAPDRVAIKLQLRGGRRMLIAKMPALEIVADTDGPPFGDLPSDYDSSVFMHGYDD